MRRADHVGAKVVKRLGTRWRGCGLRASSAISASTTWSRPALSKMNASLRLGFHFTGRPNNWDASSTMRLFGICVALHPKSAPDVRADDAYPGFGNAKDGLRQRFAYAMGILRARYREQSFCPAGS